ncbi:hypothetical protein D9758_011617 [Tetrapyrgos nigripes]|uniref:Carboxypeptidase n=1 Tax=Tetrapyrgos nigripes TaxID=182062 RepID=A0A8H5CSI3_9AGAR|nr:hypothetical protein D9758_011617 [Tetrapyrgos nigripes]
MYANGALVMHTRLLTLFSTLFGTAWGWNSSSNSMLLHDPIQSSYTTTSNHWHSNVFKPLEDLKLLSDSQFTSLSHPAFPSYGVRVKKSKFCDGGVNTYTGYIDIEARHIFFYFFESRRDPEKDDTIFWTAGGPGGSSALAVFLGLGPCRITGDTETEYHHESWNEVANVFFVDQPIGTGFSYADRGESVSTTEEAAQDIAAFIAIFFENFIKFQGRPLHLAGASYAGRYLPLFASAVYDKNAYLKNVGITPINLKSIMINNGFTDYFTMITSYYDMTCTSAGVPLLDSSTCVRMKQVIPRCQSSLTRFCRDRFDMIDCSAASAFCGSELQEPFILTGWNQYDITKKCDGELAENLCNPITKNLTTYLNLPSTLSILGIDPDTPVYGNFKLLSFSVNKAFEQVLDYVHPTQIYVEQLLTRGIKVLIMVGSNDWACNWIGNFRWVSALEWYSSDGSGHQKGVGELREWGGSLAKDGYDSDGDQWRKMGMTATEGNLTFVTVDGAGHMVPADKPKESLFPSFVMEASTLTQDTSMLGLGISFSISLRAEEIRTMMIQSFGPLEGREDPLLWDFSRSLDHAESLAITRPSIIPNHGTKLQTFFFVDQPIGVGFSYADYGESVSTTEEAAQDIAAFIAIFFEHFTKFRGRALHMAGESYGGRYIPLFASAVYDQNAHLKDMGLTPINLKSAMIGNGLTDFFTMTTSYYDMACTVAGQPVLDISTCVRMKEVVPRCQSSLKRSCVDQFDKINCYAANTFCNAELFEPFLRSGRNLYDITKMCDGELTDTLCYPITKNITNYLNIPSVQTSLGIDPSSPAYGNYTVVSMEVGMAFDRALDHAHPTQHYVEQLLHRGIKVLIYVGTNDFVCNWIGNLAWVSAMEWYSPDHSGRREKVGPLKPWGGASVSTMERWGMIAQGGGLTFATIDGAGHMVPYDKPKESLELVKRWLEATTEL